MNKNQKKMIILAMSLFLISVIYVPEIYIHGNSVNHEGWVLIWDLSYEINLKILIVEWIAIAVMSFGAFFLLKSHGDV